MQDGPRRLSVIAASLLGAALALTGCSDGPASSGTTVVTSFYPLQYVAQRIAGRHATVDNLTQPGREPHDVELSVRQTAELADADVLVYEKGFQAAVDQAVDQSSLDHIVDASGPGRVEGDDPHFWLDPTRLSRVAAAVEKQLAEADPAHRKAFARNLRGLQQDLADLDAAYQKGLASCRIDTIVVSHDAFGYLGRRYGLKVAGITGLSPDAEASPAHIRALQDLIRTDAITTVFSEELVSRKLADSLASDLGIRSAVLDPIEGLSDATSGQDYLSLMRRNLATLRKANKCT